MLMVNGLTFLPGILAVSLICLEWFFFFFIIWNFIFLSRNDIVHSGISVSHKSISLLYIYGIHLSRYTYNNLLLFNLISVVLRCVYKANHKFTRCALLSLYKIAIILYFMFYNMSVSVECNFLYIENSFNGNLLSWNWLLL